MLDWFQVQANCDDKWVEENSSFHFCNIPLDLEMYPMDVTRFIIITPEKDAYIINILGVS